MSEVNFESTFEYKLIYIFRINDKAHKGFLKIGDATIHTKKQLSKLTPNSHELNYAARQRIDSYTATAGIRYELLYTEIAVFENKQKDNRLQAFRDHKVHDVLLRSGIKKKCFDTNKKQNEWFEVDLETAKRAIKAVKENKTALNSNQITKYSNPIVFRPEQEDAIRKTINQFKHNNKMLWNAKMRFGKTLSALEVVKREKFEKTIIFTHRPVVSDGWFEDFNKIFYEKDSNYNFGSKAKGKSIKELLKSKNPFVYFASIQDLRGSSAVGGSFNKNDEVFKTKWDFVIIDEAHEGTQTTLGQNVIKEIIKEKDKEPAKVLTLSGTPFNLLDQYDEDNIYTWDYIMEQEAKQNWTNSIEHFGDSNPYDELPKMNIFTYHLEKNFPGYIDVMDKAFRFSEFFRVWIGDIKKDGKRIPSNQKIGDFVNESDVSSFLDLITKKSDGSNYPFSTEEYRKFFRHTLWVVPGVREAKALSKLLKKHVVFGSGAFNIINVAGDGDEEIDTTHALEAVKRAFGKNPDKTYSITISCGRLTTGVTVPEWTAVLMLAGSYSTEAKQYLQTIFRVQSPANIDGRMKENCYVFDFAPDRTLKMVAEAVQVSSKGSNSNASQIRLGQFLNFCPIIAVEGSNMKQFKTEALLQALKKAYAERVVKNGFDDVRLYNDELLKLDDIQLEEFSKLKKIIGTSKAQHKPEDIDITHEGFTNEEYEKLEKAKKKPKKELTEEEKRLIEESKEKRKNKNSAISILRGISIRMPLLVYGIDIDIAEDVTIDNFTDLIDELSWKEFMPAGVDKETFKKFSKYYDKDIFVAASRRIRYIAKTSDELEPIDRVKKIAKLFSSFKNPDKETVLTPWRVVNMHMSDTIGGYDFFEKSHLVEIETPRYVEQEDITKNIFDNTNSKVLEINSKSGLYPLYLTYSFYQRRLDKLKKDLSYAEKVKLWDEVVKNNIFVICKTKMAKTITKRTLLGYRQGKVNMHSFDDLVMQLREKQNSFIKKILRLVFWGLGGKEQMKFNVIVGNPPYQEILTNNKMSRNIYQEFAKVGMELKPEYLSLIMPSKWAGGELGPYREMKGFFESFTKDNHIQIMHDFTNSSDVFSNVDIKGGVCYFLYSTNINTKAHYYLHENDMIFDDYRIISNTDNNIMIRYPQLCTIIEKVSQKHEQSLVDIISSWNPYGFISDLFIRDYGIKILEKAESKDDILIYGLVKNKREKRYIRKQDLIKITDSFQSYKVFITRANGSGTFGEKFSMPICALPNEICTDTFLEVGPFNTEYESKSFVKYLKTRFFRAMVGAKKTGVFSYKDAFTFVPLQTFNNKSDIDWNKDIDNIDMQLFKKYGLSKEEIDFIIKKVIKMS